MKRRNLLAKLLDTCCSKISIAQLHVQCLKLGLAHDSFIATKLNVLYARYASIAHAHKVFEETPHKSVYLWNSLLRSYCLKGEWVETLCLFCQMNANAVSSEERPDNYTLSIALKSCAGLQRLELGRMIHGFLEKENMDNDLFVGSALIELYSKCGEMNEAAKVFVEYPKPDVVLWTSMVTGYQRSGSPELALAFFSRMVVSEHVSPDPVTLVSAASACSQLSDFKRGRSIHGFVKRRGFDNELCLANSMLNLYGKTGSIKSAANLSEEMPNKDIISWSSIVACYADNGDETALDLFNEMIDKRIEPNWVILVSALRACASTSNLEEGMKIHKLAVRYGLELDVAVSTALMDMYMKCFSPENAVALFNRMPKKDVVSWAVLLSGYAEIGMAHKSMGVFCIMLSTGTCPDAIALVKILSASSELGILQQASCLHGSLTKSGFDNNIYIGASLIELYAKCSSIDSATKVFQGMTHKDVVTWSSIIAAQGFHGQGEEALKLFYHMVNGSDVKPNSITFLSILSACSHAGLVEEGIKMFDIMVNKYQLKPSSDHYGIVVDLLGRMGELEKALDIISHMPMQAGPHVWGALLGACRTHQNIKIGEVAAKNLFPLDPNHAGYYILLSNIYCEDKNWHNAAKLRTLVKENRLKKIVGQSMVELKNEVKSFVAGDRFHDESDQIYEILRKLDAKVRGYTPQVHMEEIFLVLEH